MKARALICALALAVTAAGVAEAQPGSNPRRQCFFSRNWTSWRAPDANTIYFRVNRNEVYRVDLSAGSNMLTDPANHLISNIHGSDQICSPIDLQLRVSDGRITVPLIAKSITRLSPEEVAAIPARDRP